MDVVKALEARIRSASSLPGLLAAAFDAFEVIHLIARASEDREPELLAAFLSAADAAVDGREAVTLASSLPEGSNTVPSDSAYFSEADASDVADALARLAGLLSARLSAGGIGAPTTDDRAACRDAADAAERICQLMGRGDGDSHLR